MDAFTIRAKALRGGWPHPANASVRRNFCGDQAVPAMWIIAPQNS
ncbi:hypothetical protein QO002_000949 [Pararhizobium capsulatum DSM 1112]|uniref:Uncharacterized protein n=1 Tax=Pararhizobium capsulatum DSM 1112 TaxID=1121113 RepID=A0ABU0BKN3_9HYPH|nr:hypothetical protein [Pararhizobium capsulatum]MDQ0318811.1 hypothetical protein [Pararhizobium capsulatum DSM 1112]